MKPFLTTVQFRCPPITSTGRMMRCPVKPNYNVTVLDHSIKLPDNVQFLTTDQFRCPPQVKVDSLSCIFPTILRCPVKSNYNVTVLDHSIKLKDSCKVFRTSGYSHTQTTMVIVVVTLWSVYAGKQKIQCGQILVLTGVNTHCN